MDFWQYATIAVELIILVALVLGVGLFVLIFSLMMMSAVTSPDLGKPAHRAEDFWDENDGTMYVQLPTGEVRLD